MEQTTLQPGTLNQCSKGRQCPSRELRKGKKDALVTQREFLEPAIATRRRFWVMQSLAKDRGCCSFTSGTPYSVCIG